MPSLFEQQLATNLDGLYAQFGLTATYAAPGGASMASGTIRVHRHDVRPDPQSRVARETQSADVLCRQSEFAKPLKGGRFTVETSEVWTIENTPMLANGEYHCTCSRSGVERMMERKS